MVTRVELMVTIEMIVTPFGCLNNKLVTKTQPTTVVCYPPTPNLHKTPEPGITRMGDQHSCHMCGKDHPDGADHPVDKCVVCGGDAATEFLCSEHQSG